MIDWLEKHGIFVEEIGKVLLLMLLSFVLFRVLQYAVRWYLFGKCSFRTFSYFKLSRKLRRKKPVPDSVNIQLVPPNKKWRISNEVVSLIHSVISGLWALYSVLMLPDLILNINDFNHQIPKGLVIMSFGYMIHDLIDLLINERSLRIIELLFHHAVVITGFTVTLVSNKFMGVVMFGLLMELNSIFLHMRSLLNLYGQPKNSTAFKFVALLNVATFLVFRMAVSLYLIYWQLSNALDMYWVLAIITFLVIISLTITNSVLFYRVLTADGIIGKSGGRSTRAATTGTLISNIPGGSGDQVVGVANGDLNQELVEEDEEDPFSSSDYDSDNELSDLERGERRRRKEKARNEAVQTGEELLNGNHIVLQSENAHNHLDEKTLEPEAVNKIIVIHDADTKSDETVAHIN